MSETSTITNVAAGVDNARIVAQLATELGARASQIAAAVELLDDGATVPFIARYRKEATGGLDDTVLRNLEVRLGYLRELEERRGAILESISQQGKLTPELQQEISAADTKQRLEDLYAPYKPKRRTRAQIAREAGLEPLADAILADPACDPAALAAQYLNPEASINDAKAALDGARDILAERYAENADLLADLRSGRIDIMLADKISVEPMLALPDNAMLAGKGIAPADPLFGKGIGAAVRKGDDALREKLNQALKAVREDGTYDAIGARYFKSSVTAAQ